MIEKARYFSLSAHEVTFVNGQSWLSVELYVCIGFRRVSILLAFLLVLDGNFANANREAVEMIVSHHIGLNFEQISKMLMCFDADGVSLFQGCKNGVGVQLRDHVAPFVFIIHCFTHGTNLVAEPLWNLSIVKNWRTYVRCITPISAIAQRHTLNFTNLLTRWI